MHSAQGETSRSTSGAMLPMKVLARFSKCNSGATSIEYGLICSLIFLVIVAGVKGVATETANMHTKIQAATN